MSRKIPRSSGAAEFERFSEIAYRILSSWRVRRLTWGVCKSSTESCQSCHRFLDISTFLRLLYFLHGAGVDCGFVLHDRWYQSGRLLGPTVRMRSWQHVTVTWHCLNLLLIEYGVLIWHTNFCPWSWSWHILTYSWARPTMKLVRFQLGIKFLRDQIKLLLFYNMPMFDSSFTKNRFSNFLFLWFVS